ncbi:MFS transporter [Lentilactobacillus sp. SPB1-3]|uniref:MFS transporter n=1 Tax=Lentilactobacillus terminaliae TaxID=3003483 RepID=A0ACD5DF85_9LACO|nr:MFS transporter [Lentilactobacillus sp. SPB1-3]MCZ0976596.1 MFS transporter [Lentilactobacillus sp. SPB1-3]
MENRRISPALTLTALAINAFAIGSTEFISVGLMPLIVKSFNISLAQAGLTVSIYALGITIGAPILTVLTANWDRRKLMLAIMLIFIIGNLLAATAPTFAILLLGRIVAALAHGIFMSVSSLIAADVVPMDKRASAIAIMFTGLTVATVTGVPLGTFIGQHLSWHWSFIFIAIVGLIGLIANFFLIPNNLPHPETRPDLKGFKRVLTNQPIVLALLITALGYGGTFTSYTYLTPILEKYMHFSANAVVIILIVYGLMVAVGNTIGGRLANSNPLSALIRMFIGLAITLGLLFIFINQPVLGLVAVMLLGLFAFMNVPGLQLYIVQLAEKFTPNDIGLASALNISAFNIGITLGSFIGGEVTATLSVAMTPIFGVIMVVIAILLTVRLASVMKTR